MTGAQAVGALHAEGAVGAAPPCLCIRNLTLRYGGVVAVNDVSLDVYPGTVHGLIGPNGAGKTSLIDAISGFEKLDRGSVRLGDRDITHVSAFKRTRLGMARSFQHLELFDDLTVRENLIAAARASHRGVGSVDVVAERLGLTDVLDSAISELPHGRRRLVSVARSLATKPEVLVLDEPGSGLDTSEKVSLGQTLRAIADDGVAILLIDHDMSLVLRHCDRITVLDFGQVLAEGRPDEIQREESVRLAYLGD